MAQRRVVITGLGTICPVGNNVKDSWENVLNGVSGISSITHFNTDGFAAKIAGEVKNFHPEEYIEINQIKKMDDFSRYTLAAGKQAWADSGLQQDGYYNQDKMGCILGVGMGGIGTLEKNHEEYLNVGPRRISPFAIPGLISNLAAGHLAIEFGMKGINYTLSSACASSTHAIGEAYRTIKDGIHDVILTGGSEGVITPTSVGGFAAMKALSTRNDDPTRASRPFDKNRDGFVISEGAVVIVLEEYENANKRGAKIYAEVVGYGFSCDAYHITAPEKDGEGAISCMKMAIQSANIQPNDIDYINAHGTSTMANDATETKAIKKLFGDYAYKVNISSTKSTTGHLLGAAGAIEAMFCTLAIRDSIIPPTINLDEQDPECDLNYTPNKSVEKKLNYTLSNSFGFGGTNASLVLKKLL